MKLIKSIISVLFSAILILSATTTSSIAIDKIHFVIGGGAGGGWDGTARGTGEALTKKISIKYDILFFLQIKVSLNSLVLISFFLSFKNLMIEA